MKTMDKEGRKTLIAGLGATGFSVARFLQCQQIKFAVADSSEHPSGHQRFVEMFPGIDVHTGEFSRQDFLMARDIVLSPGIPLKTPQVQAALADGIPVMGDVELFARQVNPDQTIVAVTGTNGKSTVTILVAEMVREAGMAAAAGGNLGPPALDLLDGKPADIYVLELSSFQLETTYSLNPSVSVILNVSEDHLDRYTSLSEYVSAKQRIHHRSSCIVVNRQDKLTMPEKEAEAMISFGTDPGKDGNFGLLCRDDGDYIARGEEPWIACRALGNLLGTGGILNAQAALAIGTAIGLPRSAMLSVLRNFHGLPHRMQRIGTLNDSDWINDSKATNVAATVMALVSLERPCIWIAGGDGKSSDFAPLIKPVRDHVTAAFLFGKDKLELASVLSAGNCAVTVVDDLPAAMHAAYRHANRGDCVLLSPACASYDMYSSYIDRGKHFIRVFNELRNDRLGQ